jgi:hypothetical protein
MAFARSATLDKPHGAGYNCLRRRHGRHLNLQGRGMLPVEFGQLAIGRCLQLHAVHGAPGGLPAVQVGKLMLLRREQLGELPPKVVQRAGQ